MPTPAMLRVGDRIIVHIISSDLPFAERNATVISTEDTNYILLALDRPMLTPYQSHNTMWERSDYIDAATKLGFRCLLSLNVSWYLDSSTKIIGYQLPIEIPCRLCKRNVLSNDRQCWWCETPIAPAL